MKDVAQEAGVSIGTVSHFLNKRKVRPEAEQKIKAAISKLQYVRNNTARDLKTKGSSYVVFVLPTVWSPYFSELTFWIQKQLDEYGYQAILCISENNYEKEAGFVTMAAEQRVAGIVSVSYSDLTKHVHSDIPLVSIEKEETGMFPLISSDNYSGGQLAAKELEARGAKKLIFIGTDHETSTAMTARKSGFVDLCNQMGLKYELAKVPSSHNKPELQKQLAVIAQTIKAESENPGELGVFSYTDEVALQLLRELEKVSVSVPEDVQIIGFDGWRVSEQLSTPISSIRQPIKEIAAHAIKELDSQIKGNATESAPRIMLPVTFYQGSTTKTNSY